MNNKINVMLTKEQIKDAIQYIGYSDNDSANELVTILETAIQAPKTIALSIGDANQLIDCIVNSFDDISASPEFAEAFYRLKNSLEASHE